MLREPVERRRRGVLESFPDVGIEVAARDDDQLLGLTRPAEGFDREVGRRLRPGTRLASVSLGLPIMPGSGRGGCPIARRILR